MPLFDLPTETQTAAETLARGFEKEALQVFEEQRAAAYDAVQKFWYRNRDEDGNPSLTGDEPTGEEIMRAMGPRAKAVYDAAAARAQMVVGLAMAMGRPEEVDLAKVASPFDITFNPDGSIATLTPR